MSINYYENREAKHIIINMNDEIKNLINVIFHALDDLGIKTDFFQLNDYLNRVTTVYPNRPYHTLSKTLILEFTRIITSDLLYTLNFIRYNKSAWAVKGEYTELLYNGIISFYEDFTGKNIVEDGVFNILKENTDIIDNAFYNFSYLIAKNYGLDFFVITGYELFEFEEITNGLIGMYYIGDYRIKYYNERVQRRR